MGFNLVFKGLMYLDEDAYSLHLSSHGSTLWARLGVPSSAELTLQYNKCFINCFNRRSIQQKSYDM